MMKRILLGLLCASMSLCAVAQNRVTKVLIPGARGLLAAEVQMPENKGTGKFISFIHGDLTSRKRASST